MVWCMLTGMAPYEGQLTANRPMADVFAVICKSVIG